MELYWRAIWSVASVVRPVGKYGFQNVCHCLIKRLSFPRQPHNAKTIYLISDCSNKLKNFKQPCISNCLNISQQLMIILLAAVKKKKKAIPWQRSKFTDDAFCSQGYSLNNECAAHSFPKSSWTLCLEICSYMQCNTQSSHHLTNFYIFSKSKLHRGTTLMLNFSIIKPRGQLTFNSEETCVNR